MRVINTDKAPKAIGPYNQAIEKNNTLYISGQLPINTETLLLEEGIEKQTLKVLQHIKAILEEGGYTIDNLVKLTCYLTSMSDFHYMNEVFEGFFGKSFSYPARATVIVADLPKNSLVEIDAIAMK